HQDRRFWFVFKSVVSAALIWLILKTLILLYIFSHQFIWALPELYRFVRDTRVGEITAFSGNFYRVFIQSQIYALLGFCILLPISNKIKNPKLKIQNLFNSYHLLLIICLTTVIISFSRSFWVGLAAGLFFYFFITLFFKTKFLDIIKIFTKIILLGGLSAGFIFINIVFFSSHAFWVGLVLLLYLYLFISLFLKFKMFNIIKLFIKPLAIIGFSVGIIFAVINLPPKISRANLGQLFLSRTTMVEAAGSSRLNMLKPLLDAILRQPLIGSGFGATVTYKSADPRVTSATAGGSGEFTTYAFEWAYLDLLLKIGLFGVFIYLLLIFKLLQALWQRVKLQTPNLELKIGSKFKIPNSKFQIQSLSVGLFAALTALLAVNVFTPYLNHPLGIGFILIVSVWLDRDKAQN
ncbi:MAG: hypothetical protein UV02_C0049G0001, partial [Candidatus Kuenenbacteria bacterium GW2011_GWA2_42_15]